MTKSSGPFDIDKIAAVLAPGGHVHTKDITSSLYQELDTEFDGFAGHALVARHAFAEAWPTWEMHPKGDELVFLLSGDIDFVLWVNGQEDIVRVHQPGHYIVVPKGIWHTARPHQPTSMLFITPGEGTLNAKHPEQSED